MIYIAVLLLTLLLSGPANPTQIPPRTIDKAHSRVTFTVTKWGFAEVEGRFYDFAGTIAFDEQHPERSQVDWRVRVDSVQTGAPNRDKALQGSDYFDTARFPEMHFISDRVNPLGGEQFEVTGQMTIRDKTRPLTIRTTYGGTHAIPGEGAYSIFQTEFMIDRYDYNVRGGSTLGGVISREVHVKLIAAVR